MPRSMIVPFFTRGYHPEEDAARDPDHEGDDRQRERDREVVLDQVG